MRARILTLLLITALISFSAPTIAYKESDREDSLLSTHQFIIDHIPQIWANDGHPELAALLSNEWMSDLKRGTIRADVTLWDSREHYMDPFTHDGLLFFESAGELAESHFAEAATAWAQGERDSALMHLGWALHAVQDVTVPHHARLTFLDYHSEYEAWVLAHQSELPTATTGVYGLPVAPGHYGNSSRPFDWVDYAAHQSWGLFDYVNGVHGTGNDEYRSVASQMVSLAESLSAGFLYRMLERLDAPPIADAGPDLSVRVNQTANLDASASSDDVAIRSYTWGLPGGSVDGVAATFSSSAAGHYMVLLAVTDVFGKSAWDTVRVSVLPVPILVVPPVVVGRIGTPVSIRADTSTGEEPLSVVWTGPSWQETGRTMTHTFDAPASTYVAVSATLADGLEISAQLLLRIVDDVPPNAQIRGPSRASVGDRVSFDGSGSTDNVAVTVYAWSFGDGETETSAFVSHAFAAPGQYIVTLEVADAGGNHAIATLTIPVTERPGVSAAAAFPLELMFFALATVLSVLAAVWCRRHARKRGPR